MTIEIKGSPPGMEGGLMCRLSAATYNEILQSGAVDRRSLGSVGLIRQWNEFVTPLPFDSAQRLRRGDAFKRIPRGGREGGHGISLLEVWIQSSLRFNDARSVWILEPFGGSCSGPRRFWESSLGKVWPGKYEDGD